MWLLAMRRSWLAAPRRQTAWVAASALLVDLATKAAALSSALALALVVLVVRSPCLRVLAKAVALVAA
jgi:hypothetical protein